MMSAIAQKMDWALLAGDGATTGTLDDPVGVANTVGVHDVPYVAGDY